MIIKRRYLMKLQTGENSKAKGVQVTRRIEGDKGDPIVDEQFDPYDKSYSVDRDEIPTLDYTRINGWKEEYIIEDEGMSEQSGMSLKHFH